MGISRHAPQHHRSIAPLVALTCALLVLLPGTASATSLGSFFTDTDVSRPGDLQPANGTSFAFPSNHVELRWGAVGGTRHYQVQVATSPGFAESTVVAQPTLHTTRYVPTGLFNSGTYYWRVRAREGSSRFGLWSFTRSFEVSWSMAPTGLAFHDEDGVASTSTPLGGYLRWNPVAGAASYEVQVATAAGFGKSALVIDVSGLPHPRLIVPRLPDDTYHWRVRSVGVQGDRGPWTVAGSTFTVEWMSINDGALTPTDGAATSQWRLGWDPVTGSSRYQVQAAARPGCFFDPDTTDLDNVPKHSPGLNAPPPIGNVWCRISHQQVDETINTWMGPELIADREIFGNTELSETTFAPVPPYEWTDVYWRVRPVVDITTGNESLWPYATGSVRIRGGWSITGANQPRHFSLNPTVGTASGAFCFEPSANPWSPGCLVSQGTRYTVSNASANSNTMLMPLMEWQPFTPPSPLPGAINSPTNEVCDRATDGGADGMFDTMLIAPCYGTIIQVATDQNFANKVHEEVIRDGKGFQASSTFWRRDTSQNDFALTTLGNTLPDNETGSSYWWRAVPCVFYGYEVMADGLDHWTCVPVYHEAAAGTASTTPGPGARSFTKRANFGSGVSTTANFAGSSPLLQWNRIDGADHYEVQLARNAQFSTGVVTMRTTARRMIPYADNKWTELADGPWFWRVRAVDYNGITSQWANTHGFTKATPAPVLVGPASGTSAEYPVLRWSPVTGANFYQVQYSDNASFPASRTTSVTTRQTGFLLKPTSGTWYWRVRVNNPSTTGTWSEVRQVGVTSGSELTFAMNRNRIIAGQPVFVTGEVRVNDDLRNNEVVRLQQKARGSYRTVAWATTGRNAETGRVRIGHRPHDNSLYRLARVDGSSWQYSAPFRLQVSPRVTRARFNARQVRRGSPVRVQVQLNRRVSGRAVLELRHNGRWHVVGRRSVTRQSRFTVNARIQRAGSYPMRVRVVNMPNFAPATTRPTRVRVNDLWRFYGA